MATTSGELEARPTTGDALKEEIAAELANVRERTLRLVEPLSDEALNRVHSPLMSPIVWDLGHIATFEDLWLVQNAFEKPPLREELGAVYDPFRAPRSRRGELPFLHSHDVFGYMGAVRERALACLAQANLGEGTNRLLADGFVYELILCHERQHSETILQTLQIMTSERYEPETVIAEGEPSKCDEMVLVGGGAFELGAGEGGFAYDNERPRHAAYAEPFRIDATPVSNGAMIEFIEDDGYERRELWSEVGWDWKQRERISLPLYWSRDGGGYAVRSFTQTEAVDPAKPVCHVSWYEADAFARWASKRLPTEVEWEKAASWDDGAGKRCYPWGDERPRRELANLDQLSFETAACGSYAKGASPCGARQLLGDVWEWTASDFVGYPGFAAYPYREYSEVFFGGPFKVLRGGAWATQPRAITTTFRNWDYPERRQLFAGFRCARNAEDSPKT